MSKMASTSEELIEDIERVPTASTTSLTAFFVLFDAFGSMAIIDLAEFGVDESFVRFGHFDEFLGGRLIVGVFVGMELLGQAAVGFFEVAVVGRLVKVEDLRRMKG